MKTKSIFRHTLISGLRYPAFILAFCCLLTSVPAANVIFQLQTPFSQASTPAITITPQTVPLRLSTNTLALSGATTFRYPTNGLAVDAFGNTNFFGWTNSALWLPLAPGNFTVQVQGYAGSFTIGVPDTNGTLYASQLTTNVFNPTPLAISSTATNLSGNALVQVTNIAQSVGGSGGVTNGGGVLAGMLTNATFSAEGSDLIKSNSLVKLKDSSVVTNLNAALIRLDGGAHIQNTFIVSNILTGYGMVFDPLLPRLSITGSNAVPASVYVNGQTPDNSLGTYTTVGEFCADDIGFGNEARVGTLVWKSYGREPFEGDVNHGGGGWLLGSRTPYTNNITDGDFAWGLFQSPNGLMQYGNLPNNYDATNPPLYNAWNAFHGDSTNANFNIGLFYFRPSPMPIGLQTNVFHYDGDSLWLGNSNGVASKIAVQGGIGLPAYYYATNDINVTNIVITNQVGYCIQAALTNNGIYEVEVQAIARGNQATDRPYVITWITNNVAMGYVFTSRAFTHNGYAGWSSGFEGGTPPPGFILATNTSGLDTFWGNRPLSQNRPVSGTAQSATTEHKLLLRLTNAPMNLFMSCTANTTGTNFLKAGSYLKITRVQ